jgi:hypothetical protein
MRSVFLVLNPIQVDVKTSLQLMKPSTISDLHAGYLTHQRCVDTTRAVETWDWYRLCANGSGLDHGGIIQSRTRVRTSLSRPLATELTIFSAHGSGYEEFRADYELILSHIGHSYSRNRGSNGARTRTVTANHVNLVAWHGTSATATGQARYMCE